MKAERKSVAPNDSLNTGLFLNDDRMRDDATSLFSLNNSTRSMPYLEATLSIDEPRSPAN